MSVHSLPAGDVVLGGSAGRLLLEDSILILAGEDALWAFFITISLKHQWMYSWRASKFSPLSSRVLEMIKHLQHSLSLTFSSVPFVPKFVPKVRKNSGTNLCMKWMYPQFL